MIRRDAAEIERWVRGTHDTGRGEDLRGIGYADGPDLVTWHVTDDPERLLALLRQRRDLVRTFGARGRHAELGPGLYVGEPRIWQVRAQNKWSFLKYLTPPEIRRLTAQLDKVLDAQRAAGRITAREHVQARYRVGNVREGSYAPDILVGELANQPFNIAFWRSDFLSPLEIAPAEPPRVVELRLHGRFAELVGSHPPASVLRLLRRAGFQGVYTRAGMSTNPELVVWDRSAITRARLDPDASA